MFGLGPTELAVILVLALLVMGPKRIPELASNLGKAIRSFRRATRELREQIDIDDEVRRPFEDLRSALRDEPPRHDLLQPASPVRPPEPAPPNPYDRALVHEGQEQYLSPTAHEEAVRATQEAFPPPAPGAAGPLGPEAEAAAVAPGDGALSPAAPAPAGGAGAGPAAPDKRTEPPR